MRCRNCRRAFTIVELLISLAVIGLLISLIIPSVNRVRHAARTTSCLNNMRNLALAHQSYMGDHDGRFIDAGLPHGNTGDEQAAWINTLPAYIGDDEAVLRSPLDESPHWAAEDGGRGVPIVGTAERFRRTSYGINNYLTQYSPHQFVRGSRHDRLTEVRSPATTVQFLIMAFEEPASALPGFTGGFPGADHPHVESWSADPPRIAATQVQTNAVSGPTAHHEAVGNWSFLDGHVASLKFHDVYVSPDYRLEPGVAPINKFDPDESGFWMTRRARSSE